ncbi:MAG TPA: dienelactone hydrolase family protein [Tepidisphaeraceae bacterium]|jgi:dienelactone hydrolase|nr:dienelactone hydrolase family protein [Tepidisphaeraceae bacterium]
MKHSPLMVLAVLFFSYTVHAKVVMKEVDYKAGDTDMVGYVAYDDQATDKRPGVLVFPEWWGNNDYTKFRAQELVKLGYIAFAADMYGKGVTTDDPKQAGEWSGKVKQDANLMRQRVEAALAALKQQPNVDADKLAAIGYCFGGGCAINMARFQEPIKGVVSFHGDLSTTAPAKKVDAKLLVCAGAADPMVPPSAVETFKKEMGDAGADLKVITYPDAQHAFTNPNADSHHIDGIKYNEAADKKSWEDMKGFLSSVLGK